MSETALITGASSGLGMEYAKLFAADKRDVVLVARRRDRLHALANELTGKRGIKAYVIAEDLVDPAAPQRIVEEVNATGCKSITSSTTLGLARRVHSLRRISRVSWQWSKSTSPRWSLSPELFCQK